MESGHRRGFRFKNNKLYVFGADGGAIVVASWPVLRAVVKRPDEPCWQAFEPVSRLVRPYRRARSRRKPESPQLELGIADQTVAPRPGFRAQRKRAFDAFRFSLPRDVAARVERFSSRQWRMLLLCRERMEALDLAGQSPALFYGLANCDAFRNPRLRVPISAVAEMSKHRQREIIGWLGFPDSEGAARIAAKILAEAVSEKSLLSLRSALGDPETRKRLAHLPVVNAGVLGLIGDERLRRAAMPKLLAEVSASAREKYRAEAARLLADTLGMQGHLARHRAPPSYESVGRLREVHRELSAEFCRTRPHALKSYRLPRPPLPGTRDIVPLLTPTDLIEEGEIQSNCVATYVPMVAARELFIYRVLRPERATLSIVRGPDGAWEIDQLQLSGDREPGRATVRLVERWLERDALTL